MKIKPISTSTISTSPSALPSNLNLSTPLSSSSTLCVSNGGYDSSPSTQESSLSPSSTSSSKSPSSNDSFLVNRKRRQQHHVDRENVTATTSLPNRTFFESAIGNHGSISQKQQQDASWGASRSTICWKSRRYALLLGILLGVCFSGSLSLSYLLRFDPSIAISSPNSMQHQQPNHVDENRPQMAVPPNHPRDRPHNRLGKGTTTQINPSVIPKLPTGSNLPMDTNSPIPSSSSSIHLPRVVYLRDNLGTHVSRVPANSKRPKSRTLPPDPLLQPAPPGNESVPQDRMRRIYPPNCVPIAEWQAQSFVNCNAFHEINMGQGYHAALVSEKNNATGSPLLQELGTGWFRTTWKWSSMAHANSSNAFIPVDNLVLKTLRTDREFYDEYFDLHRRDAVAMERLSHSPFVMNVYGYCGQSALNEVAEFTTFGLTSLESLNKFLRRGKPGSLELSYLKLQLASSVAVALAHVHEVTNNNDDRPTIVHYDINPRNVAIVAGGKPKLNDFNTAEFLYWDPQTNKTCGFPSRFHEPWWRAPEEVVIPAENQPPTLLDEKVDIYSLGNLLFHILTTRSPRGKMKRERMEQVREEVAQGQKPVLPPDFDISVHKDIGTKAMLEAMDKCFSFNPADRPSARDVAEVLLNALVKIKARLFKKGHKPGGKKNG